MTEKIKLGKISVRGAGSLFFKAGLALILSLWILSWALPALAQTTSGFLTSDEIWSGTVTLTGDVTIPAGLTLMIQPGTTVIFPSNSDDQGTGNQTTLTSIEVLGELYAVGTPSQPIVFTGIPTDPLDPGVAWDQIRVLGPNNPVATIRNCIIEYAVVGFHIHNGYAELINNTIVKNTWSGIMVQNTAPLITNNIIVQNGTGINVDTFTSTPTIAYNDVYGNDFQNYWDQEHSQTFLPNPGTGEISSDPLFVDDPGGDYHLQASSPCINTGDPDPQYDDLDGSRNDMGAYGGPYADLIAYYKFDGDATDSMGLSYDMVLNNTEFINNTLFLNGLYSMGNPSHPTGYYAVAGIPSFNFDAFTISLDFYPDEPVPEGRDSLNIITGGTNNRWFRLHTWDGNVPPAEGDLRIGLNNPNSGYPIFEHVFPGTSTVLSKGQWHNVVASVDLVNYKVTVFLDGTNLGEIDVPDGFNLVTSDQRVINFTDTSQAFTFFGFVDNLRVYDRALSATEIQALVGPPPDPCDGLGGDTDGDGICDDGDGSGIVGDNPCTGGNTINCDDNCPMAYNPVQGDADEDEIGDLCDICHNDPDNDADGDGVCGDVDNCPMANPGQTDQDEDGVGDICDDDWYGGTIKPEISAVVASSPDGSISVSATVTMPAINWDGETGLDNTWYVKPDPYNVVVRVFDSLGNEIIADRVLCGPPCSLPDDLVEVTVAEGSQDHSTLIPLSEWHPNLPPAEDLTLEVSYINQCDDLDKNADGTCPEDEDCISGIWRGAATVEEGDRVDLRVNAQNAVDQCPDSAEDIGGTGCPLADYNYVALHTVYLGKGPSTKDPLRGAEVRVFDRNDIDFQTEFGKNPKGSMYGMIFEPPLIGYVGACITDANGECYVGEAQTGDYLVIARYMDSERDDTVYIGRPKGPSDFVDDIAEKKFQFIKVHKKDGTVVWRGGSKTVVNGSFLEIISPESAIWEGTQSVYPFIFTSDSNWTVDVCAEVPAGYSIVGVYDENGDLIPSAECIQAFVSGESKTVAFEVQEIGSPEPWLDATLNITSPKGKKLKKKFEAYDIRMKTFKAKLKELRAKKKNKK